MKKKKKYGWLTSGPIEGISWKLVVMPKEIQSQDSRTTFKPNLVAYVYLSEPIYFCNFLMADPVGREFDKTFLDSKYVLKVYFKHRVKNPDFGFLPHPSKPAWLKNDHLR